MLHLVGNMSKEIYLRCADPWTLNSFTLVFIYWNFRCIDMNLATLPTYHYTLRNSSSVYFIIYLLRCKMFAMKSVCANQVSAFTSCPEWLHDEPLPRKLLKFNLKIICKPQIQIIQGRLCIQIIQGRWWIFGIGKQQMCAYRADYCPWN
jgi:hypothetical protein